MTTKTYAAASFAVLFAVASAGSAIARTIALPAGTPIRFKLLRSISTATAKSGQSVPAELTAPIVISGNTVARAGAPAAVQIRSVEASGRIGGSIRLANGSTVAVRTSHYAREGKAHAKHNATVIAAGGILGALAGQAIGHDRDATAK